MNRWLLLCALTGCLVSGASSVGAGEEMAATDEELGPDVVADESELVAPSSAWEKPTTFESWAERTDFIHNNLTFHVQSSVDRVDTYFAEDPDNAAEPPPSRFRLGMYMEFEVDGGVSFALDPDYDLQVELPNLEQRWDIIVTGKNVDELPGVDPNERESGVNVGIQKGLDKYRIKTGAGIKVKWLPEGFAEIKWVPTWSAGEWQFRPQVKGYYVTDDGFGNINSLSMYRWVGKRRRGIVRSVSAGKWTELTDGFAWEQTLIAGYVPQLLEKKSRGRSVSAHDTARAVGLRYSIFGHKSGTGIIDRHRATLVFRFPLYRNFIFGEILPEVEFKNENDWDPVPKIRLGIDLLFWGIGSPR